MARKHSLDVLVNRKDLTMLCLYVDYGVTGATKDALEEISVRLAKKHDFDTHEFRLTLPSETIEKEGENVLDACRQNQCPKCGSSDIEGESVEVCAGTAEQPVSCNACDSTWTERYALELVDIHGQEETCQHSDFTENGICGDCGAVV